MIQPEEIRQKAENIYPKAMRAWLDGEVTFFPRIVPCRKSTRNENISEVRERVERLREASKEIRGFGYTVEWSERNSRAFGRNSFPQRIVFETCDDLVRFLGRKREFTSWINAVEQLRERFPELESWIRSNFKTLAKHMADLDGLIKVLSYFRDHPRPNMFARELPLDVDTKFVERHERLLREWFDIVLPPTTIHADETHFERRYGLLYAQPHLLTRLLDPHLQQELGLPWDELSLPLSHLNTLPVHDTRLFIVENKVNLLTLPPTRRGLAICGMGRAVTNLRYITWLSKTDVLYWGDLDVEGFQILSSLRRVHPHVESFLMDINTLNCWEHLSVAGRNSKPMVPAHLTDDERMAFVRCRDDNIRLEQEHIPHSAIQELSHFES